VGPRHPFEAAPPFCLFREIQTGRRIVLRNGSSHAKTTSDLQGHRIKAIGDFAKCDSRITTEIARLRVEINAAVANAEQRLDAHRPWIAELERRLQKLEQKQT
jgi:hypothetical protein